METITEPARQVPVIARTDLLVVGSGPGGLSAAISAARMGVETLLVERYGCFGGNLTHVGVEGIGWYRQEHTVDVEGIGIEFESRAKAMGGSSPEPQSRSEAIDAEMFKVVADGWIAEAGVRPLLHSAVVGVVRAGESIAGVIVENKSGRGAILAKRVVDATGDADVASLAGAHVRKTARERMLPVTVMFSCAGVDRARFLEYVRTNPSKYADWGKEWAAALDGKEADMFSPYLERPFDQAREQGVIPEGLTSIGGTWSSISAQGEATYLNMVHMTGYDGTDVWDLTRAEMDGRRQALLAIRALQRFAPGFEAAKLRNFGMTLGVRDTRKIVGRYDLTEQDVRGQRRFEDRVGIFPEFIDGYGLLILPTTGRYFDVPFGALVPTGIDNLLVAGRSVAGDEISHAAVRNMMCCTVTGQAAGVAAAVSLHEGRTTARVDVGAVQRALRAQGVRL
ncbi:MAG: FAD-dependent oxidoreductase [Myxococcales bacterium FL481]|nr:MAG: FAD-dependent oxidoreductase [Myxococcales bacterium FL481]